MNFKILVLASLAVAAVVADDTFLMESDFGRYLAATYTYAQATAACTIDGGCDGTTTTINIPSCCAKWTRTASGSTTATSLGNYCAPVVTIGSSFVYATNTYSPTSCQLATNTAAANATACTANTGCTTTTQCCRKYTWDNNTASIWTSSSTLGSYCGPKLSALTTQAYTYVNVGVTTAAYLKG